VAVLVLWYGRVAVKEETRCTTVKLPERQVAGPGEYDTEKKEWIVHLVDSGIFVPKETLFRWKIFGCFPESETVILSKMEDEAKCLEDVVVGGVQIIRQFTPGAESSEKEGKPHTIMFRFVDSEHDGYQNFSDRLARVKKLSLPPQEDEEATDAPLQSPSPGAVLSSMAWVGIVGAVVLLMATILSR
jgi:hypothetical protein